MKKLYVQEIERVGKVEKFPGPDKYTLPSSFGSQGIKYTMRQNVTRLQEMELLEKRGMMPGPGSYKETNFIGKTNSQSNKTPIANAFSNTQSRFHVPSKILMISITFFSSLRKITWARFSHPTPQLHRIPW
jgi:hypothetical protein